MTFMKLRLIARCYPYSHLIDKAPSFREAVAMLAVGRPRGRKPAQTFPSGEARDVVAMNTSNIGMKNSSETERGFSNLASPRTPSSSFPSLEPSQHLIAIEDEIDPHF